MTLCYGESEKYNSVTWVCSNDFCGSENFGVFFCEGLQTILCNMTHVCPKIIFVNIFAHGPKILPINWKNLTLLFWDKVGILMMTFFSTIKQLMPNNTLAVPISWSERKTTRESAERPSLLTGKRTCSQDEGSFEESEIWVRRSSTLFTWSSFNYFMFPSLNKWKGGNSRMIRRWQRQCPDIVREEIITQQT